jgi:hypothetical protein
VDVRRLRRARTSYQQQAGKRNHPQPQRM